MTATQRLQPTNRPQIVERELFDQLGWSFMTNEVTAIDCYRMGLLVEMVLATADVETESRIGDADKTILYVACPELGEFELTIKRIALHSESNTSEESA